MKKYIFLTLLTVVLFVPSGVFALTNICPNGMSVASNCTAPVSISNTSTVSNSCSSLILDLTLGSRDAAPSNQVTKLQTFLHNNGYLISNPTGYFGSGTLQAVKDFQTAVGISGTGNVGSLTREKINALSCGTVSIANSSISPIIIISPNGGEVLRGGTTTTVTFKSTLQVGRKYEINLLNSNGAKLTWNNGYISANQIQSAVITLPSYSGNLFKLQVISCDSNNVNCIKDVSNNFFSLTIPYVKPATITSDLPGDDSPTNSDQTGSCTGPDLAVIANGASKVYYQPNNFTNTCTPQTRTCTNGVLNGTFTAPTCIYTTSIASCVPEGGSLGAVVAGNNATCCTGLVAVPLGFGNVGSYGTCQQPTQSLNCVGPGNIEIANGSSRLYYGPVSSSNTCARFNRICTNGVLSGNNLYVNLSCDTVSDTENVQNPQNLDCIGPGNISIANGSSGIYWGATANGDCLQQPRTCTNGVLNGTFTNLSCVDPVSSNTSFFDYNIGTNGSVYVNKGSSASGSVIKSFVTGTTQAVYLSASHLPFGVSVSFSNNPSNPTGTNSDISVITFIVSSTAIEGFYPITITGTSKGLLDKTVTIMLGVLNTTKDFSASVYNTAFGQNSNSVAVANTPVAQNNSCLNLPIDVQYRDNDSLSAGAVSQLQNFLQTQGYLSSAPTGYFGNDTFTAVKSFQLSNGVKDSGYVGALTRAKIQEVSCK